MWIPLDDESTNEVQNAEDATQESVLTIDDVESGATTDDTAYNPAHPDDTDNPNNDTDSGDDNASEYDVVVYCSCKAFWASKPGRLVVFVSFMLLSLASLAAFCVVIQMIVVPYCKVSLFQSTNCSVVGVSELLMESHCTCSTSSSRGCDAQYMCLIINVQFSDAQGISHNASISDNEVLLGKKCSFFPNCKASHAENLQQMKEYEESHGALHQSYPCLYNPIHHHQVIRTHRFRLHHVIHGLVWSSAFLVATSLVLVFAFIKFKGCKTVAS